MMWEGEKIRLRPVKLTDVPKIVEWENNEENWEVSETKKAYSFQEILLLLESAEDLYETGQLRLMIDKLETEETIGTMDLFQTDFNQKTVGMGILIAQEQNRRKGYAKEAVVLTLKLCKDCGLEEVFCHIQKQNEASIQLFKNCGFQQAKQNGGSVCQDVVKMNRCLRK